MANSYVSSPCSTEVRTKKTCVATRRNRCCSPGDTDDDDTTIITPLPAEVGSTLCCEINKQDIDDVRDRLQIVQRQLEVN